METKVCLLCKKEFQIESWRLRNPKRGRFCSKECARSYYSGENSRFFGIDRGGNRNPSWKGGLPLCSNCSNVLTVRHGKTGLCHGCYLKQAVGENSSNWHGGTSVISSKNWKRKNKDRVNWLNNQRRIRIMGSGGSHSLVEWETLKAQYNWTCPACGMHEPDISLSRDHIIPLSKGGSDNIENIQPLCTICNCKKHTKSIKFEIWED